LIRHAVASAVLVSALALSAPSRAQLVETRIQPSTDANANWSATAGQTAGAGNAVLQFEAGWPGIGFTYLKGLDERSDVGFHIGVNYGIEGTTTTLARVNLAVPYRPPLAATRDTALALPMQPGPYL